MLSGLAKIGVSAIGEAAAGGHSTWNIEGIYPLVLRRFIKGKELRARVLEISETAGDGG